MRAWISILLRISATSVLILSAARGASAQQVTENCTVSVLNRTVTANADGTWVLPNVPANFGPVRARATCVINGQTVSGESEPFSVPANGVVNIPKIHFGQTTPIPTALTLTASPSVLTQVGDAAQLTATARYSDGSTRDVTSDGTTYTISNAAIATVSAFGSVQAVSSGTVIVQAMHEGASGMTSIRIALAGTDTDGDGIPDDVEVSLGMNPNNPVDAQEDFDRDGLTNLQEYQLGTELRKADTDGDGLKDGEEVNRYFTNPLLRDTDGDGVNDGLEVQTGSDPRDPGSLNLPGALSSIAIAPSIFTLTFNTVAGDASVQLKITGTLKDGATIDLTSTQRGTNYTSSDLTVCSFGAASGRVFAGASGACTITATLGTLSATAAGTVTTFAPRPLTSVALGGPGNGVDVGGDFVYVAAGGAGLKVVDVTNRNAPHIAATLSLLGSANDVKLSGSRAFVAAGAAGLSVVDISNPLIPRLLGSVDTPGEAIDVRVRGDLAFVADGAAGLEVIDVSNPSSPRIIGHVATGPAANGVDIENTLAVVVTGQGGVRIVDVSNPSSPVVVGALATPGSALDVVVRNGFGFVADYTGSLRAVDFRTPTAPVLSGTIAGNLGGYLLDVALMDTLVFGADVFFVNGVPITDVGDPNNLRPRPRIDFPGDAAGLGIAVDGSYIYLGTDTGQLYVGQYRFQQDLNGIPPTVAIASPVTGATFVESETIPVAVTAMDDLAVTAVMLLVNGVSAGTDTTAPYQFNITAPVGATSIVLGAQAGDLGNNTGTATDVAVNIIPDPLTTVVGRVVLANGTLASGATVECRGLTGVTGPDGTFSIAGVPTTKPTMECKASAVSPDGTGLGGVSARVLATRAGTTAIGDVVIAPVPVVTSIAPNVVDATRPPTSLQIIGVNLTGATFAFVPALVPAVITAGTAQINASGTIATLPIAVSAIAHGRFILVGTSSFGVGDDVATPGNVVAVFSAADDIDTDVDGYPGGLELLFGSDPQDPASVPDFTRRGDLLSAGVSVSNTQLPEASVQTAVSAAVSVSNTLLPATTEQTAVSAAVSVSNTQLPATSDQTAVSAAVSVSNTALPALTPQSIVSSAFSVSNTALGSTAQTAVSSAVSILNSNTPIGSAQPPARDTSVRPGMPFAVTLDEPHDRDVMVEGATIAVRATVTGAPTGASVAVSVNGQLLAIDGTAPYEVTLTVPAGVRSVTFAATARTPEGGQVDASSLTVGVVPDPMTTVTGRVVDAAGNPIAGAWVDVLSAGLQAEFFRFSQPLAALPDLTGRTPDRTARVTALAMRNPAGVFGPDPFGTGLSPDYAVRFTGWVSVAQAGRYEFILGVHDGARLVVGGATVVDLPVGQDQFQEGRGAVDLPAGLVPIEVTYYEGRGNAELQLSFATPGGERQIVPTGALVPGSQPFVVKTDASGRFEIAGVPTALRSIQVRASVVEAGQMTSATSDLVTPVAAAGVNVGDIVIRRAPR